MSLMRSSFARTQADPMKMDVDAIRAAHGDAYDGAIQQMGEYVWGMGQ
jgi:hypothetical protein